MRNPPMSLRGRSEMARPIVVHAIAATALVVGLCAGLKNSPPHALAGDDQIATPPPEQFELRIQEGYPDWVVERLKRREQKILDDLGEQRSSSIVPHALVIFKTDDWKPGQKITVAFNGGNPRLHALIERLASEWSEYANIQFDFGRDASGHYRTWSANDKDYAADVRIGFKEVGFWSLVGRDSVNPDIAQPGVETLNLQGFDTRLPMNFAGVVRHEFGHTLGLEHEHQGPQNACDFRWNDDPGYVKTKDNYVQFVADKAGRHPGIYTSFGGPPNNWSKNTIDYNLRPLTVLSDTPVSAYGFGPFDKLSIMKYYYEDWMFVSGKNSPCYSPGTNYDFSAEDERRIAMYYPKDSAVTAARLQEKRDVISSVLSQIPQSSLLARELLAKQQRLQ
jgi:hypothetical protein